MSEHKHQWVLAIAQRHIIDTGDIVKVWWACSCGDIKLAEWREK